MNKKYKVAIFDLDGVIVDTAKFHFIAWNEIANRLDYNLSPEQNELLKGVNRVQSLEIILNLSNKKISDEEKELLLEDKNNLYVSLIEKLTPKDLLPGSLEILQFLKEKNIKIVLGSASKNASAILNKLQISSYFDAIIDGTKVSKPKPNPEVFTMGAKAVGAKYSDCVVFEDSIVGIEAAKKANMLAIGIGTKENLKLADTTVENMNQEKIFNLFD